MSKIKRRRNHKALQALGDAIRDRRVDLLLTQDEIAKSADLHRTYVTDVEGGVRNLSYLTLLRIAKPLGCPLSQILIATERLYRED